MKCLIDNINNYTDYEINNFILNKQRDMINNYHGKLYKQAIVAEMLLKKLLKCNNNLDYNKLDFYYNENGKPFIKKQRIFFSISHSYDYVIVVISNKPIGVDIEKIRTVNKNTIELFMNENEINHLNYKTNEDIINYFTKKEAYIKMMGYSLSNIKNINIFDIKEKIINKKVNNYSISICEK